MAIIDRVKWDGNPNIVAWKHHSEELSTATQLIVNESQEAFLVSGGVYEGPFGAGRHTLETPNIPILRGLFGLPFGGKSPFSAEVWYVNKAANLNVLWGTQDPIQLTDPKYNLMIPVRAFGQYGVKIADSKKFLVSIVGTLKTFDQNTLSDYFRGIFLTRIKTEIANWIIKSGVSVLDISVHLLDISQSLTQSLRLEMEAYGVHLEQFNVQSINVPENDPAVMTLKTALAKRAEMGIVGFNYQQEQSFNVLKTAAGNEGNSGGVMSAGLGLGMGVGLGGPMGQMLASVNTDAPTASAAANQTATASADRITALKALAELKAQGILTDEEFDAEKKHILAR